MTDINTYTTAEISALTPQSGDVVLDTDLNAVKLWNGSAWKVFDSDVSPFLNGYSVEFDGVDDYIDMGSTFQSTFRSNNSVSLWLKRDRTTGEAPAGVNDTSGQSYFYIDGSSLHFIYKAGSTRVIANGSVSWNTTDWFHVVGTVEQSGSDVVTKVYLNGSLLDSTTGVATLSDYTATDTYVAGRRSSSFFHFQGLIDEVAIFNSALSASQITNIYRGEDGGGSGGTNGVPGNLDTFNPVGWWRMGDTGSDHGTATITNAATGSNSGGSSINASIENGSSGNTSPTYHDLSTAPDSIYVA